MTKNKVLWVLIFFAHILCSCFAHGQAEIEGTQKNHLTLLESCAELDGNDPFRYSKYFHPKMQELCLSLIHDPQLNSNRKYRLRIYGNLLVVLGAVGDETIPPFLKKQMLQDSKEAALVEKPIQDRLDSPSRYGIGIGLLVYRKVPGAKEVLEEMSQPEYWQEIAYPKDPRGKLYFQSHVLAHAWKTAGVHDAKKILAATKRCIGPDELVRVDSEHSLRYRELIDVFLKDEGFGNAGPEMDKAIVTFEARKHIQESFHHIPAYLQFFALEFQQKLEKEAAQQKSSP